MIDPVVHLDLVRRIAGKIARRLPRYRDVCAGVDDLCGVGMIGLIEAAGRYAPGSGATFGTFAGYRIRGRILDYLRSLAPESRKDNRPNRRQAVRRPSHHRLTLSIADLRPGPARIAEARDELESTLAPLTRRQRLAVLLFAEKFLCREVAAATGQSTMGAWRDVRDGRRKIFAEA